MNNSLVLSVVLVLMLAPCLQQERIFENKIPAHIPIRIKIRKEKEESFKDLKNEKWLREFELEVTNTGDRPIYYLEIVMGTEVMPDGLPEIVIPMHYGRAELGDVVTKATSDDVPIKPGETVILTAGGMAANWEKARREYGWPDASKFRADFQILSFGDGTGYWAGEPYPSPGKRKAPA